MGKRTSSESHQSHAGTEPARTLPSSTAAFLPADSTSSSGSVHGLKWTERYWESIKHWNTKILKVSHHNHHTAFLVEFLWICGSLQGLIRMSETREAGKANDVPSPPCGVLSPLHEDSKPHSATALSKLRIELCSWDFEKAGLALSQESSLFICICRQTLLLNIADCPLCVANIFLAKSWRLGTLIVTMHSFSQKDSTRQTNIAKTNVT